jgi:hypothetical protein
VFEDKHSLNTVWLFFQSGLELFVVITPRERAVPDYASLKRIYGITPDEVHYWSLIKGWGYRDAHLLLFKWAFLQDIGHPGGGSNPAKLESLTSRPRGTAVFSMVILEVDQTYYFASTSTTPGWR